MRSLCCPLYFAVRPFAGRGGAKKNKEKQQKMLAILEFCDTILSKQFIAQSSRKSFFSIHQAVEPGVAVNDECLLLLIGEGK